MARGRFQGCANELAQALAPVVFPLGRSWLRYDDHNIPGKAKLNVDQIAQAHDILDMLHQHQANLSFTRKVAETVVRELLHQFQEHTAWKCREDDVDNYVVTLTNRFCNICRAVSQGEVKHPECSWVSAVPWRQSMPEPRETPNKSRTPSAELDEEDVKEAEVTYLYGWDPSLGTAWRCPRTRGGNKQKGLATEIRIPMDAAGSDPVEAIFSDGSTWNVSDVTVDGYKIMKQTPKSTSAADLWVGVHKRTQHGLKISLRKDRSPLYVLFEQRRHVMLCFV